MNVKPDTDKPVRRSIRLGCFDYAQPGGLDYAQPGGYATGSVNLPTGAGVTIDSTDHDNRVTTIPRTCAPVARARPVR